MPLTSGSTRRNPQTFGGNATNSLAEYRLRRHD
ncbi:hypothetical protein NOCA2670018 [metagenome]|uniref:Uncharacterized protein n=1 Tax=metagenome TaxID=256318 RepID=A0A2P2CCQ3_9ZZZZ